MKPDGILETLPAFCQVLVKGIEAASGLEVQVMSGKEFRDSYDGPIFGGALPDKPEAVKSPEHALVLFPRKKLALTFDEYHHELLHLHIAHVHGQPEIRASDPDQFGHLAGNLDNEIDHLVIHIEQCKKSEAFKGSWIEIIRSFWQKFPQETDALGRAMDPDSLALVALTRYFKTRRIAPSTMVHFARQKLRSVDMLSATHQAYKALDAVWPDKAGLLPVCAGVLDVPIETFKLCRIEHSERIWDVSAP